MKISTRLAPVTAAQIEQLSAALTGTLSEAQITGFRKYTKPYNDFGKEQLDNIWIIAEVTIEGNGTITSLEPMCNVDQFEWWRYEDEDDIRIDPVVIPFTLLTPAMPLEIASSATFLTVLQAENNVWDLCKELPEGIWNERQFDFMLWFVGTTADGNVYEGSRSNEYAGKAIEF